MSALLTSSLSVHHTLRPSSSTPVVTLTSSLVSAVWLRTIVRVSSFTMPAAFLSLAGLTAPALTVSTMTMALPVLLRVTITVSSRTMTISTSRAAIALAPQIVMVVRARARAVLRAVGLLLFIRVAVVRLRVRTWFVGFSLL
jgi:hypothetical protein